MKQKNTRNLIITTVLLGTVAGSTLPMAGCEPVSTTIAVTTITVETLALLIAEGAFSYLTYKIGEAIYVWVKDAISGEDKLYPAQQLPAGTLLEVQEDGSLIMYH